MKMPIEWHRECLKNISEHYDVENSALAKGRDGFDAERFMKIEAEK